MDITKYTDSDGFVVKVGDVLQWNEMFWDDQNENKYYVLVALPDLGDMLRVQEILPEFSWNEVDGYGLIVKADSAPFEVEPWKMGPI